MAARGPGPGLRVLEVLEARRSPQDDSSYRDLSAVEGKVTSDSGRSYDRSLVSIQVSKYN